MLKNHLELTADRCGTGRWYINIDGGNLTCSSLEEAKSIILRELGVEAPKWKPVSDPPKYAGYYSVYDGRGVHDCYFVPNAGFIAPTTVTHWMPLPEPPKEENSE